MCLPHRSYITSHRTQLCTINIPYPVITQVKSNFFLSPSAVDTAQHPMYSKKDGLVQGLEADTKIYLSYSTNRKPIASLLHDIMTDVRGAKCGAAF